MADNTIDFNSGTTFNSPVLRLGSLDECRRLGFIYIDEQGIMSPSASGMVYLMFVVAGDIIDTAEAFAAGYPAAFDEQN